MTRIPGLLAVVYALAIATGCLFETRVASTEVLDPPGKGVVSGIIYDSVGAPSPGTLVRAFPVDFNPVSDSRRDSVLNLRDSTDEAGGFSISGVDSGLYNLLAVNGGNGSRLLIRNVRIGADTRIPSGANRLQTPGAMTVIIPDTLNHQDAYVFVPGTPIYTRVDTLSGETHPALLDSVPAGEAPGIAYAAPDLEREPEVLAGETTVRPRDTVPAGTHPAWLHDRRIFINTSGTSGAPRISGTVTEFPLLVRLASDNFDFREARGDGRDIRFTRSDGAPLSHEIETWDSAAARASIWVRMDSVKGNHANQFIRMYWGNFSPSVPDQSAGSGVFRSPGGYGYRGVWHLAEPGNTAAGTYRDATAQGNHGTGTGFTAVSKVVTPIGNGQAFAGPATYINAGTGASLHSDSNLTLEAWVRIDTYQEYANFISKAFTADMRPTYEYGLSLGNEKNNFRFVLSADTSYRDLFSAQNVILGRWYHLAGTFDGLKMRLFIDGVPTDSVALKGALHDFKQPLMMGRYEHNPQYSVWGILDETRMSNIPRSADYIKLSFENQRQDSRLLRFEAD